MGKKMDLDEHDIDLIIRLDKERKRLDELVTKGDLSFHGIAKRCGIKQSLAERIYYYPHECGHKVNDLDVDPTPMFEERRKQWEIRKNISMKNIAKKFDVSYDSVRRIVGAR